MTAEQVYSVVRVADGWAVNHNGQVEGNYSTKEAAFEAAVGPASNSIKRGYAVRISVDAAGPDEPAPGKD